MFKGKQFVFRRPAECGGVKPFAGACQTVTFRKFLYSLCRLKTAAAFLRFFDMYYFSIHTQQGAHVGFFIMLPDDESETQPQSGRFAVKLQSEEGAAAEALAPFGQTEIPQYWRVVKDRIELFFDDAPVGSLRNEYLTVSGQTFVLTDLTGAM